MNCKELAQRLGLEEEEYLELLELFVETTGPNLAKLQGGLDACDSRQVLEAAHTIKGSSANLGLAAIAEVAKEIEEKARHNSLQGAAEAAQSIKGQCEQIAHELKSS
jgi:HPt (histidine-containing phosphotransfer) domain-containing protein